jgi:hypothetical protein
MTMTLQQLEAEVKKLQEQVAEGQRARDELEIMKVQSLYSHLYTIGMREDIPGLFARKTPGVTMEIEDSGVHEGIEHVTYFWNNVLGRKAAMSPGMLAIHMTCNPIIEINKARTRAKGVWHSHGFCALGIGGNLQPLLCLGKYDMEYVKEDGRWKIFTFIYRQTFMSPYFKGWVDEPTVGSIAASPENKPDKPTTFHMPYNRNRINIIPPPPPKPYED